MFIVFIVFFLVVEISLFFEINILRIILFIRVDVIVSLLIRVDVIFMVIVYVK